MTEKIVGYSLLVFGVFLIIISAVNIYLVFSGQTQPIQIFHMTGVSFDLGSSLGVKMPATEIISAKDINQSSNLFAHVVLMGFIASTGQKLASLGVQLVRPIVVKYNEPKA